MPSRKMSDKTKFAIFILTHGRPQNVRTYDTLRRSGYTGKIYIVIDNEDPTGQEYKDIFGADNVFEFDKGEISKTFDVGDTNRDQRTIVYARNATQLIAKELGLDYHAQFDDDYHSLAHRSIKKNKLISRKIEKFDQVVSMMLDLLEDTNALTVALSQGGDHIGGILGNYRKGVLRKAMNSQFIRTDRPVKFVGRINEDVNSYVVLGSRGQLFFTITDMSLHQVPTQSSPGGMTDTYLETGTYLKSFFTVMMAPSSVKIRMMGQSGRRLHHSILWENTVPKIISPRHRKK